MEQHEKVAKLPPQQQQELNVEFCAIYSPAHQIEGGRELIMMPTAVGEFPSNVYNYLYFKWFQPYVHD